MQRREVTAMGKLAGQAIAQPATVARGVHSAVSRRTFGALGILGAPVRVIHDAATTAAYRSVSAAISAPVVAGSAALATRLPSESAGLADTLRGGLALGALNGAIGDALAREYRDLALELTVRERGRAVVTDSAGLAEAFPDATPRIVVFVHGLCETEDAWRLLPLSGGRRDRAPYGARLRDELGYTPVYVRYNTGLRVSDNGRRLAEVLEHLARGWPVEAGEIALVGHSMGGLVARSACHYGERDGHRWTDRLRHVFCLGTPHLGAPLEKAANVFGWALGRLPEARPFAALVNGRSAGIKDMRYGNCVEEDWCDCDADEFLRDRCCEVPFLPSAAYYFIGATVSRRSGGPAGSLFGDLLVSFPSASGKSSKRRIPFEVDNGCHVGGIHHLQLLNHPAVYRQIRTWLERGAPAQLPAAAG
jgi:pimeloyl-ACP methyl ester carboxylesterase